MNEKYCLNKKCILMKSFQNSYKYCPYCTTRLLVNKEDVNKP